MESVFQSHTSIPLHFAWIEYFTLQFIFWSHQSSLWQTNGLIFCYYYFLLLAKFLSACGLIQV